MQKINKCRTLADFTPELMKQMMQSNQNNNDEQKQNNEESSKEQQQGQGGELEGNQISIQEQGKSEQGDDSKQEEQKDNKTEENLDNDQQSENNGKNEVQQSDQNYLYFTSDEFLITTYQLPNGWWYGYKDTNDLNNAKFGYFPSNYVQVIENYHENEQEGDVATEGKEQLSWNNYAEQYLNNPSDSTLKMTEQYLKDTDNTKNIDTSNPEGILRYKKIKIHESQSHSLNPDKGGIIKYSAIAVKDQSDIGKSYRQMYHYFDYEKWNDQMNEQKPHKSKPDPSRKKKKGNPKWMDRLG